MPPIYSAIAFVFLGTLVGVLSGMMGVGGGVMVIPLLMMAFGFSQARANGTSLMLLLPPIGIFAALSYYRAGNVDVRAAAWMALGFAGGAWAGAWLINSGRINATVLRVMFALLLTYIAGRMLFRPGGRARAALEVSLLALFGTLYGVMRLAAALLLSSPSRWGAIYRRRQRESFEHDYEI